MTLKEHYQKNVIPKLKEKFGYKNIMAVPRVKKVVVNIGIPSSQKDTKIIENVQETLRLITGQNPVARKARKSIASFKIRQGQDIGFMVTLRGNRMYDFLERLTKLTFARIRDFRGLNPNSFDANGNWSMGFRESVAFPEAAAGDTARQHGLEIVVVTTAKNKEEGLELLKGIGFPFREK